jgi:hypothetical protein
LGGRHGSGQPTAAHIRIVDTMQARLEYGRKYRAIVAVEPMVKSIITDEMVAAELRRWQLFGQVTAIVTGYQLEAEFRGKSGTYPLPDEVQSLELIE